MEVFCRLSVSLVHSPAVSCITDRETRAHFHFARAREPKLHTRSLLYVKSKCGSWLQVCCTGTRILSVKIKKASVIGSRQRERKEETMKGGTACASGSSGTLTSESITDVFIPLSSSLAYFPFIQPPNIPSPLLSSTLFFSFHVSESLPFLHSLSSSIFDSLCLLASQPQPLPCPYAAMRASCVQGGCAGFFTVPVTFSTFLLLPRSRVWVSDLPRWSAT